MLFSTSLLKGPSRVGLGAVLALTLASPPTLANSTKSGSVRTAPLTLKVLEDHSSTRTAQMKSTLSKTEQKQLHALQKQVKTNPRKREHRLALVSQLMGWGRLNEALAEARRWRDMDAYNLVVVRLIGDIQTELGHHKEALRTYSAVVELLAADADAQRALAAVLKQSGRLDEARSRLLVATQLRPEDKRLQFELADVHLRLGEDQLAKELFVSIVADEKTPKKLRYPAKQRLAQLLVQERRTLENTGKKQEAERVHSAIDALKIKGGVENDIKIYLTWDTDRTDVDLWVTTPNREKIFYQHRKGSQGGALFDDVTDGYGPESFTQKVARPGEYLVQVNFYGTSRRTFREARGEVTVITGEGTPDEERTTIPYRLRNPKETVTVARVVASRAKGDRS